MNFLHIAPQLLFVEWVLIFLMLGVLLYIKLNLPTLIGKNGEHFVSGKLLQLNPDQYSVLDDLMLPSQGNLGTTQIDHLVVSDFGIFVLETKSYSGWILGNARQQYWTQVIYRYKKKFYNPLRQNFAHIKAVESLVRPHFTNVPIVGFVAFPSADKLQISGTDTVGYTRDIVRKIESYQTTVLSGEEKQTIIEILRQANIRDKKQRKLHDTAVRSLKSSRGY